MQPNDKPKRKPMAAGKWTSAKRAMPWSLPVVTPGCTFVRIYFSTRHDSGVPDGAVARDVEVAA